MDDAESTLDAWQQRFAEQHAELHRRWRERLGDADHPVVVRLDDHLHLLHGGNRRPVRIHTGRYHELRKLSHLPVAVLLRLNNETPGRLRAVCTDLGRDLRATRCPGAEASLADLTRPLLRLLDDCAQHCALRQAAVSEFAERVHCVLEALQFESAELEIEALHEAVDGFRERVGDDAVWRRTFFVVCAGHQPRYREVSKQFFQHYLASGPAGKGGFVHRVVYAEGLSTIDDALDLVAETHVGRFLGEAFMGDVRGMERDVLGDAARAILKRSPFDD